MADNTPIINSYCDYIINMSDSLEKELNKKHTFYLVCFFINKYK